MKFRNTSQICLMNIERSNMKNVFIILLVVIANITYGQTYEEVKSYINDSTDIKHKEIVFKQSILETGWFTCNNCSMDKNNIFGWYYKKKYLSFTHWKESVLYYERWQNRHYKGGDYYQFLINRGYATDKKYIDKLKGVKLR